MVHYNHIIIPGTAGRAITLDVCFKATGRRKPVVIFAHGFKGFKDWGPWSIVADHFARRGMVFIKFNFSHNGVTPDHPDTFDDLEAFGRNTYSKELTDLNDVINWVYSMPDELPEAETEFHRITLIGHSRGGGVCIIKAAEDERVNQLITWASVSRLDYSEYFHEPRFLDQWKKRGVIYVFNARTLQEMPLNYTLYTDFLHYKERLNIQKALQSVSIPCLFVHGSADQAVSAESAKQLHSWCRSSSLLIIPDGDHTFGATHPYTHAQLIQPLYEVCEKSADFVLR